MHRPSRSHYRYTPDSDVYDAIAFGPPLDLDSRAGFDGRSHAERWVELEVVTFRVGTRGDFPALAAHIPVFSERAWNVLQGLVAPDVEALPVREADGDERSLYLINVTTVLDALDSEHSIVEYARPDHIQGIDHYALRAEIVDGHHMFRVRGDELGGVIVDEVFRDTVERHELRGLIFEELP